MLSATLHAGVAVICADLGVSMLTASYVSEEIQNCLQHLNPGEHVAIWKWVDPGIDHMSAMRVLDRIKLAGLN